jgi:methionyl-tRNA formyltransferase
MKKIKRVVIFGNQQISLDCARWLLKQKSVELIGFVGCERPRDKQYGYPSARRFCEKYGVPYYQPEKLDEKFYEVFKSWKPDICLSIYYRLIFNTRYLSVPRLGFVNLHPSLLPKYRGAMPSLWALFNGEKKVGVTMHYIDRGIDSGDIIAQKSYVLPENITGFALHTRLMEIGLGLIKKYFLRIINNAVKSVPQDHSHASYYSAFDPKLRTIDWFSSGDRILSRMRALTKPYDGAVTHVGEKEVIFWSGKKYTLSKKNLRQPGKVIKVFKNHTFVVSCVDGFLHIKDFTVSVDGYKGQSISLGDRFM